MTRTGSRWSWRRGGPTSLTSEAARAAAGRCSDTFLRAIYDSEGRYQSDSYNDDFGGSRDSRVTFTASQSGTYYVRASGDRDETGSYTLRVSDVTPGPVEDPPPVEPPAETVASAEAEPARAAAEDLGDITELAAPRFPLGTLDGGGDTVAWYRFTLSEAREVALGLRRQDADADLVLEDAEPATCCTAARAFRHDQRVAARDAAGGDVLRTGGGAGGGCERVCVPLRRGRRGPGRSDAAGGGAGIGAGAGSAAATGIRLSVLRFRPPGEHGRQREPDIAGHGLGGTDPEGGSR